MKKPFTHALAAALYIVALVLMMNATTHMQQKQTVIIPIAMLGLFVLSAAIMGYLFLAEPIKLYMEQRKHQAMTFFMRTVGFFAGFVALALILLLIVR